MRRGTEHGKKRLLSAHDTSDTQIYTGPGNIEVLTFGIDHPGATASGARVFYEQLGFVPAETAAPEVVPSKSIEERSPETESPGQAQRELSRFRRSASELDATSY
ncbi:hypothetical protein ACH474_18845 [Nocardia rhamnosiphila]|uniref:hypothetical protein n=1 Tax=Nocardia TaxID=1817 RepID=UPI001C22D036|nr:hypothetical protein [Nocardia noduli]